MQVFLEKFSKKKVSLEKNLLQICQICKTTKIDHFCLLIKVFMYFYLKNIETIIIIILDQSSVTMLDFLLYKNCDFKLF